MRMLVVVSIAALAFSSAAFAHQPGEVILRVGVAHAAPDDSSSKIKANGAGLAGTRATVGNDTQLGLTGPYIVAPHFGIELLAATPFTHQVKVKGLNNLLGPGYDGNFGKVTHLPPTLSAQYFFMDPKSKFQPYAGVGLNYTMFFNEKLSSRAKGNGFSKLKLDDSWGLALQLGADYQITDKLFLNAAVWKIDMKTKAKANLGPTVKVKVDVDVDPWVFFAGLGYKF